MSQRHLGSLRGPTSKAPPAHMPSLSSCLLGESRQNACLCSDVCVEQVLGHRAAWRDQKSEIKPHGTNRDVLGLLGPSGHFCPPLLLNRIALYSQRVLIGQDLPSTICVTSFWVFWYLGSAIWRDRRYCQMVCVLFEEEPSALSLLLVSYVSFSLQIQLWLARNSRLIP